MYALSVTSMAPLAEVAADLRHRADQIEPSFCAQRIIAVAFPDAIVTGHALPPGIDEAVSRTPDGIVILYRRDMSTAEQRFAICHALGHLLFDGVDAACRPGRVGIRESEERADAFAAELLVPLSELEALVTHRPGECSEQIYLDQVDVLASFFHVPAWVVDKRIRELPHPAILSSVSA